MSAVLAAQDPDRLRRVIERAHSAIQILPWSSEWRDQALPIMREMHANSIFSALPLDEAKVIRQISACGNLVPDRYFKIAVLNGEGLGAFYGHVQRSFFCDEILAHDMGWWVKKDAHGSLAAPLLLLDFEQWAREKGARKVMVGQSTEQDIEKTTQLFRNCGFRVTGYNTVKDL